jgi:hypothetical protein
MYLIDRASAKLQGADLGIPLRVRPNPKIGDVPLPARGIFAIGQAHWEILDEAEYLRTRADFDANSNESKLTEFQPKQKKMLKGKTILIAGGGSGIVEALATNLSKDKQIIILRKK